MYTHGYIEFVSLNASSDTYRPEVPLDSSIIYIYDLDGESSDDDDDEVFNKLGKCYDIDIRHCRH